MAGGNDFNITSSNPFYDVNYTGWGASNAITPNTYYLPALRGEADIAAGQAISLQRASGQTANLGTYFDSDGMTLLAGLGANFELILPHVADTSAARNSIYYSTTQNKAVYQDSAGNVFPLY